MNSSAIRTSFREFFETRGHRGVSSSPLVPHGDPTLMFTNAGMVQFKDIFLGTATPPAARAVTVQKCLRVSGKHNDLENVGPSPRHHTFFEMLGNFSFGDYFKEEAIRFAWDLVTEVWQIPEQRLFATVFEQDDEAHGLWQKISTLPDSKVLRCGEKDNFWAMGDTGPCGPCSEIFVDTDPDAPAVDFLTGSDNGRYLEIWNLVFMQYDRSVKGDLRPLPNPSIDTGAGLERLSAVLQGVQSNYDSDLFQPILKAAAALADTHYGADPKQDLSLRVVADHLRAVTFLLSDGVVPASEGRGYVLRRILRRAVRHGMTLGFEEPFLHRLIPVVDQIASAEYPDLLKTESGSMATVEAEEKKFLTTLAVGSRQVQHSIDEVKERGESVVPGRDVFRLYDTFGLPLEVIREIAQEEQIGIDEAGFETELSGQRQRSRSATSSTNQLRQSVREVLRAIENLPSTQFIGYSQLAESARVLAVIAADGAQARPVERLEAGESGVLVLDVTPFYAQAGGQVGDTGSIVVSAQGASTGEARVGDTARESSWWLHMVEVTDGSIGLGDPVAVRVDEARRRAVERNHTATHLLHAALRRVLGDGVRQAGSLVAPDRLRFDFTAPAALDEEQLAEVEGLVNQWVLVAGPTQIEEGRSLDEARTAGAMALFGEKYGDTVRTVELPALTRIGPGDGESLTSLELCGGCHVRNIGEIGPVVIVSEKGVASGVRRIEALTGTEAYHWQRQLRTAVDRVSTLLGGASPDNLVDELQRLQVSRRDLEKEISDLRIGKHAEVDDDGIVEVAGIKVLSREVPPAKAGDLRSLADVLRSRLGSGVVLLASRDETKVSFLVAVSEDLTGRVDAGGIARGVAEVVGGKGGGRPDFAQAGGRQPEKLPEALAAVAGLVEQQLGADS